MISNNVNNQSNLRIVILIFYIDDAMLELFNIYFKNIDYVDISKKNWYKILKFNIVYINYFKFSEII